jgi:hypothetical protein
MPLEDTEMPNGELKPDAVPIPSAQDAAPDPARVLTNAARAQIISNNNSQISCR